MATDDELLGELLHRASNSKNNGLMARLVQEMDENLQDDLMKIVGRNQELFDCAAEYSHIVTDDVVVGLRYTHAKKVAMKLLPQTLVAVVRERIKDRELPVHTVQHIKREVNAALDAGYQSKTNVLIRQLQDQQDQQE